MPDFNVRCDTCGEMTYRCDGHDDFGPVKSQFEVMTDSEQDRLDQYYSDLGEDLRNG